MLAGADLVAFVATVDLDASHRFYGSTLGLTRVEASDFANVYDAGGTQLRVTRVEQLTRAPYTVVGWRVDDIRAAVAGLLAAGVPVRHFDGLAQNRDGIWTAPGGARI